ncbi:MAG: precorrin-8X methylmutase [Alphaproteobacteria bacterium]|nr:precorrin-8X methylmutase [Alphaproteobacteria bacterium]
MPTIITTITTGTAPIATETYLKDPRAIVTRSWELIQAETDVSGLARDLAAVALRLVHATGMPEVVADLRASPGAATAGRGALSSGAPILCDSEMTAAGITRSRLPAGNDVVVTLNDPRAADLGKKGGITRSAAAVELWGERLAGAVVAIGNAPTALFRLLELIEAGAPRPALVLGFAVGFVGAAESKAALAASGLPFITLLGRRGGSALAAAAVNALASDAP